MSRSTMRLLLGALLVVTFGFTVGFMLPDHEEAAPLPAQDQLRTVSPTALSPVAGAARSPEMAERIEKQEAENRLLERRRRDLEISLAAARSSAGLEKPHVILPPSDPGAAETAEADEVPDGPLPFPEDASASYTPEGFEDVALRATKECGMPLSLVALDCSEYPCMAWTRITGPNESGQPLSMDTCGPWAEAFENGTTVIGSVTREGVVPEERYVAWMALPERQEDFRQAMQRARLRAAEMKEALNLK